MFWLILRTTAWMSHPEGAVRTLYAVITDYRYHCSNMWPGIDLRTLVIREHSECVEKLGSEAWSTWVQSLCRVTIVLLFALLVSISHARRAASEEPSLYVRKLALDASIRRVELQASSSDSANSSATMMIRALRECYRHCDPEGIFKWTSNECCPAAKIAATNE